MYDNSRSAHHDNKIIVVVVVICNNLKMCTGAGDHQRKTVANRPWSPVWGERSQLPPPVRGQTVWRRRTVRTNIRQVQVRVRQTVQFIGRRSGVVRWNVFRTLYRPRGATEVISL